ncbi:serine protease [Vibrio hannami]|uniref:S1 family peptidase n=1 Tax=Vibrio hannami TaxID=2717094 RepID=UPI00240F3FCF|nr:serine protease [Vibrio hannami]MDG3085796.1 serine protease [Vibrio hannami]
MTKFKLFLVSIAMLPIQNKALSAEISTQIYNGTEATVDTFPSIATLYYDAIDYTGLYGMYCGATILDEQHVLTAAHCLYDGNGDLNEDYLVYTSVAIQMENESQFLDGSVEVIRASEFYPHSDYVDSSSSTGASWPNDIAIIKLDSPISVSSSDYVVRASDDFYRGTDGEPMIAVGHGYTENGDEDELLQTTLNYEAGECDLGDLNDSQICMTGELDEDTGVRNTTCSGDSGGPLYWFDGDEYVQAGITSYGWSGCYNANSDDTSVFTEVVDYQTWIASVLAGNEAPSYTVTEEDREDYEQEDWSSPDFNTRDIDQDDNSEESSTDTSSDSGGSSGYWGISLLLLLTFRRHLERNYGHNLFS